MMIYQRTPSVGEGLIGDVGVEKIDQMNTVLKGQWKLTTDEVFQDFIYKKVGPI